MTEQSEGKLLLLVEKLSTYTLAIKVRRLSTAPSQKQVGSVNHLWVVMMDDGKTATRNITKK